MTSRRPTWSAGYRSIGDGGTSGFRHYINGDFLFDGIELDPMRVESVVVDLSATPPRIASTMYILNWDKTMASTQDPASPYYLAGELTSWHDHDNLCFDADLRLRGLAQNGVCPPGTNLVVTPPMLHVWLRPYPACGPFAGIESHGGGCTDSHPHEATTPTAPPGPARPPAPALGRRGRDRARSGPAVPGRVEGGQAVPPDRLPAGLRTSVPA